MSNSEFELPSRKTLKPKSEASLSILPSDEATKPSEVPAGDASQTKGEPKYPVEELLRVFDEIIFSGEYQETYNIRGKVPITFRTRTAEEISVIQRFIDSAGSQLISTVENIRSLMNLKFSLCNYRGKDLSMLKDAERTLFIEKLPAPIVGMLLVALSRFDNKVAQACQEGEENF